MHILLDVLLCDWWEMALVKVVLATQQARSDIIIMRDHMRKFVGEGFVATRHRCLYFARRLHHDEQQLDLLWMMLAAKPGAPWTYGFMDRLTPVFTSMSDQISQVEERMLQHATERFERWKQMAGGFPSITPDPFKAVTTRDWNRTLEAKKRQDRDDRAAAATAAAAAQRPHGDRVAAAAASSLKASMKSIRDHVYVDEGNVNEAQENGGEDSDGVWVLPADFKATGIYKPLAVNRTMFTLTPDIRPIRDTLRAEFEHAHAAIDLILCYLRPDERLSFRPFALLGNPGCGKSRLIRRLGELLGCKVRRYDAAGSSDNAFGGTPKRWHSASPCFPLQCVADTRTANPLILIDEVDKGGASTSGSLANALIPFLEKETASSYPDPCLEVEADLSHVNYAMTANDDSRLPSPLRDRIRIIRVPSPGVEHIESLSRSILKDLAVELNVPLAFMQPLGPDELSVVSKMWGENGSVRRLQKIIRGTVTARDQHASRH